jgi:hypothetical protein
VSVPSPLAVEAGAPLPSVGAIEPAPPVRVPVGWAYAAAGTLALAALLVLSNPAFGSQGRTWPWQVSVASGWTRASATVFALGAAALVLLACAMLRASGGRALLAVLAAAVVVLALESEGDRFLSVASWAGPALAALLAGALYAGAGAFRGAGRATGGVAAFVLAALLLYPLASASAGETGSEASIGYSSPLLATVAEVRDRVAEGREHDVRDFLLARPTVITFLYAVLAVLGLLYAALPARGVAWAAVSAFAVAVAYPLVHGLVEGWAAPERYRGMDASLEASEPSLVGLRVAGGALTAYFVPTALGVFGATADLVRSFAVRRVGP